MLYSMSFIRKIKKGDGIYLAEVESKWINGRSVQRHIRYIGKESDGRVVLSASLSDAEVTEVKLFGPLLVLHHLAKEIGLPELLGEYANEILSMVYAHCLDYKSLTEMRRWFKRTDLNMLLNLEELTEKRLVGALDSIEAMDREELQRDIFHSVEDKYKLGMAGVIYDVTNTYLYGKKCPFGKFGHDKDGVKGRPLIQIGLGVTRDEGIPIFHKVFDGNIHGSKTLQDLITSFRHYGLKTGTFIYDRGIISGKNITDIKALKWETLCGVAITEPLKKFWRPVIQENAFLDISHRVQLNDTVFYLATRPYAMDTVKGMLALCFNRQQQLDLRESRLAEIVNAQSLLQENKRIKPGLECFFNKDGKLNQKALKDAEEFDGYSCIFSTKRLDYASFIALYFGKKDLVEKAFRALKGVVKLRPLRHWLYKRVIAHIFICYLSYLLLSLLKLHLKPLALSPEQALTELDTMYRVYLRDRKNNFKISRVVTLSKIQERILRAVNKALLKFPET
jgi:transposase